jgi:uncharacterized membrane protein YhaH (DUF805 family)
VGVRYQERAHAGNLPTPIGGLSGAYRGGVTTDTPPPQVRFAGVLVGLQGAAAIVFAVLVGIQAAGQSFGSVLGEVGLFVVIGLALVFIGAALAAGRRGARTPAIVTQLLLLPVVYSLIGPSQQLVLGILAGAYVVATFLLLISERSRVWAMAPYSRER